MLIKCIVNQSKNKLIELMFLHIFGSIVCAFANGIFGQKLMLFLGSLAASGLVVLVGNRRIRILAGSVLC